MSIRPPKDQEKLKAWWYKAWFGLLLMLMVGLTWFQHYQDRNDREKAQRLAQAERQQAKFDSDHQLENLREELQKDFREKTGHLQARLDLGWQHVAKILEHQAALQSNPEQLSTIADAKEAFGSADEDMGNLKAWVTHLQTKQNVESLRMQQARLQEQRKRLPVQREILNEMQPVWTAAVAKITNNALVIAKDYYDGKSSITNDFTFANKLMSFFSTNHPVDTVTSIVVARITLGENADWECTCTIVAGNIMSHTAPAEFNIECKAKGSRSVFLQLSKRGGNLTATWNVPGRTIASQSYPLSGYRTNIVGIVNDLFAVQEDEFVKKTAKNPLRD